jgi:hypothetical protein
VNTARIANDIRTQAEAFACALEVGAVAVDAVVAWADAIIEREDHPHWAICELATCRHEYPPDVVRRLRDVPGVADVLASKGLVLRILYDSLTRDPRCADQVARSLYNLAMADEIVDPELKALAWWAWDALDLADARTIEETRDDVIDEMRSALECSALHAATSPG